MYQYDVSPLFSKAGPLKYVFLSFPSKLLPDISEQLP